MVKAKTILHLCPSKYIIKDHLGLEFSEIHVKMGAKE
jgi:hypothetical protein